MFKIAKHFFSLFLILAFTPLLLMFFVSHFHMKQLSSEKDHYIFKIGQTQLKSKFRNFLETNLALITKILNVSSGQEFSKEELKILFDAEDVLQLH